MLSVKIFLSKCNLLKTSKSLIILSMLIAVVALISTTVDCSHEKAPVHSPLLLSMDRKSKFMDEGYIRTTGLLRRRSTVAQMRSSCLSGFPFCHSPSSNTAENRFGVDFFSAASWLVSCTMPSLCPSVRPIIRFSCYTSCIFPPACTHSSWFFHHSIYNACPSWLHPAFPIE